VHCLITWKCDLTENGNKSYVYENRKCEENRVRENAIRNKKENMWIEFEITKKRRLNLLASEGWSQEINTIGVTLLKIFVHVRYTEREDSKKEEERDQD